MRRLVLRVPRMMKVMTRASTKIGFDLVMLDCGC